MHDPVLPRDAHERPPVDLFRPPWADPTFILATCYYTFRTGTGNAAAPVVIAPANPRRVALLVAISTTGGSVVIYPSLGNNTFPYQQFPSSSVGKIITLFNDGPVVCDAWFAGMGAMFTWGIYEWIIGPG